MSTQAPIAGLLPTFPQEWNGTKITSRKTNPFNSDVSVADTIADMSGHVRQAINTPQISEALHRAGCAQEGLTEDDVIQRVFRFIKGTVTFVEDDVQLQRIFEDHLWPTSKELLINPAVLLSMAAPKGDCDDFSMLACAMLMAKGIQCDFVTIAANGGSPREFSHVYCMARTRDGRIIPFDSSHGKEVGWETNRAYRKQVWPVFGGINFGRGGMGGMVVSKHQRTENSGVGFLYSKQFNVGLRGLAGLGDCTEDDSGNVSCTSDDTSTDLTLAQVQASTTPGDFGVAAAGIGPGDVTSSGSSGSSSSSSTSSSSSGGVNWNNLLASITSAASKIAVQTTQQPGVQSTTCNAQGVCTTSSTVLPAGYTGALNTLIPGTSTTLGSILPLLLIAGVVLFATEQH